MARPLRIELAGGLYHVTSRGDRREDIYRDDDDREAWLAVFGEVCARFNWRCHAYCQMSNHYHLVVETPEMNLSRGMRQLNGVYTQRFNRRHGVVGHLFQGRFEGKNRVRSCNQALIRRESYSMARPLRIELAGGLYHVTSRGDRREDIYRDDDDREAWLAVFGEVCARFNWRCHAYCQMSNHYHLVVETPEMNLSRGMRQLNGVYTQRFNRRHGVVGHLFQGRFKGILVERDAYLLELARYVVLNPVRAGMVADAGEWPWSSYGAMVGHSPAPVWLETDWLLAQFGAQRTSARGGYVDFVRAGVGLPSVWSELRHQIVLGGEAFAKQCAESVRPAEPLREVPRAQRRMLAKPLEQFRLAHADQREAMALAYLSGDYTMKELAEFFGVHYSTVSRAVRWIEHRKK